MKDNFSKLSTTPTLKSLDTKINKLSKVIKDPDGYLSGLASDNRVSKVEEEMAELSAKSHAPVDFNNKLDSLHSKIDLLQNDVSQLIKLISKLNLN